MDSNFDEKKETEYGDKDGEISRSVVIPLKDPPLPPVGILRLDVVKPRRSSAEFRYLSHVSLFIILISGNIINFVIITLVDSV